MKGFLEYAEEKVQVLAASVARMQQTFSTIIEYFGEDSSLDIATVVYTFCKSIEVCPLNYHFVTVSENS